MAGLQASSKFPAAPATMRDLPVPLQRPRNAHSRLQIPQDGGSDTHGSQGFTRSHRNKHTHAAEHLLTPSRESSRRGDNPGFRRGPGLPREARVSPNATPIMDSRAAGARGGKLPHGPGRRGAEKRDPREQSRTRPPRTQRRGAPREPQLAPLYLPTERCAGGRGRRAEDCEHPAGTPAPGRARLWGAPAGARRGEETRVQGGRPSAHRRPLPGGNSPGSPAGKGAPLTSSSESP